MFTLSSFFDFKSQKSAVKCAISNVDQVSLLRIIIEDEHHLEMSPNFPANFCGLSNVHSEEFTPYSRHFSGTKRDTMKPEQNLCECLKEEGEISESQIFLSLGRFSLWFRSISSVCPIWFSILL